MRLERVTSDAELDVVLEIETLSFSSPWTREMYQRELENLSVSHLYVLRVPDGSQRDVTVGFCSFWLIIDELHINNLAVRPDYRRQGLGMALLTHAMDQGVQLGATQATLEVRRSNEAAQRLYRRLGFEVAGVRRLYYANPTEDALVLCCRDLSRARAATG